MKDNNFIHISTDRTELVGEYLNRVDDYKQLCAEVAYILDKRIGSTLVQLSSVTFRCKTLKSFIEKIGRKSYKTPFDEITDIAGVRVTYLYKGDFDIIEKIIQEEFTVIEKVDKLNEKGADMFGYGAVHFIVKIGKKSSGARYDELKNLVCEVQVRTVLQDAWALIAHHLAYKRESEIPANLQRQINSLSGLFETADNQFESVRQEREKYLLTIQQKNGVNNLFQADINLDTFRSYLKWKFPDMETESSTGQLNLVLTDIIGLKLKTVSQIDRIVERQSANFKTVENAVRPHLKRGLSAALYVDLLISLDNEKYSRRSNYTSELKEILSRYHWQNGPGY